MIIIKFGQRSLWPSLVVGLSVGLCSCSSTKLALPPTVKGGSTRATISLKRIYSVSGAIHSEWWYDWGDGIKYTDLVLKLPSDARKAYPVPEVLQYTRTRLDELNQSQNQYEWLKLDYISNLQGRHSREIVMVDSEGKEIHNYHLNIPPNVTYVGKVGPGGTLVWDRPPGRMRLGAKNAWGEGILRGFDLDVQPGKTYSIEYRASNREYTVTVTEGIR